MNLKTSNESIKIHRSRYWFVEVSVFPHILNTVAELYTLLLKLKKHK